MSCILFYVVKSEHETFFKMYYEVFAIFKRGSSIFDISASAGISF